MRNIDATENTPDTCFSYLDHGDETTDYERTLLHTWKQLLDHPDHAKLPHQVIPVLWAKDTVEALDDDLTRMSVLMLLIALDPDSDADELADHSVSWLAVRLKALEEEQHPDPDRLDYAATLLHITGDATHTGHAGAMASWLAFETGDMEGSAFYALKALDQASDKANAFNATASTTLLRIAAIAGKATRAGMREG